MDKTEGHTPGPWVLQHQKSVFSPGRGDSYGVRAAGYGYVVVPDKRDANEEVARQHAANMHLIAQAPALQARVQELEADQALSIKEIRELTAENTRLRDAIHNVTGWRDTLEAGAPWMTATLAAMDAAIAVLDDVLQSQEKVDG